MHLNENLNSPSHHRQLLAVIMSVGVYASLSVMVYLFDYVCVRQVSRMIDTLERYMDQWSDSTQVPSSPSTHVNKAIQRIKHLNYIHHAWVPEVRLGVCLCGIKLMYNNNNNNNSVANVFGAAIVSRVVARVHRVRLMNVEQMKG